MCGEFRRVLRDHYEWGGPPLGAQPIVFEVRKTGNNTGFR